MLARRFGAFARLASPGLRSPLRCLSSARQPAEEADQPKFKGQTKLLINNHFVDSLSGNTFNTINPATGEVIAAVAAGDAADVNLAVESARTAFEGEWTKSFSPRERGQMLFRLASLVEANAAELAALESLDNGKSLSASSSIDVPASASMLRYWAGWADKINGKQIPMGPGFLCYTRHEPVGVVGAIVPWNLPLIACAAKLGPALTCGNTVVLKPAEQTPLTALKLGELAVEAGFPAGVLNVVPGLGHTAGAALAEHPHVDKISFTGSLEVGKKIQMASINNLKRVTLELGGKNPSIVFADADLDAAVQQVFNGVFWNKGEACAAGTRIFVEAAIFDEFVRRCVHKAKTMKVGNPFSNETELGALVSDEQLNKVMGYVQGAIDDGATLHCGGKRIGDKGFYMEPTVFTDVTDDMRIFREEVFGPVMTLTKFSNLDEVVRRANDTEFGLAAGVFTRDISKGHEVVSRLRAGIVFWNCYHAVDVSAPFGGFKQSGLGREGGEYGLQPYLEVKNVVVKV